MPASVANFADMVKTPNGAAYFIGCRHDRIIWDEKIGHPVQKPHWLVYHPITGYIGYTCNVDNPKPVSEKLRNYIRFKIMATMLPTEFQEPKLPDERTFATGTIVDLPSYDAGLILSKAYLLPDEYYVHWNHDSDKKTRWYHIFSLSSHEYLFESERNLGFMENPTQETYQFAKEIIRYSYLLPLFDDHTSTESDNSLPDHMINTARYIHNKYGVMLPF